jgi:hypothetical protein
LVQSGALLLGKCIETWFLLRLQSASVRVGFQKFGWLEPRLLGKYVAGELLFLFRLFSLFQRFGLESSAVGCFGFQKRARAKPVGLGEHVEKDVFLRRESRQREPGTVEFRGRSFRELAIWRFVVRQCQVWRILVFWLAVRIWPWAV